ncbi:hypothetical protein M885DRAFT_573426 [Pelagophyceae sp. CCMP2097]|nr:hypothetical protein M885DRAFT_573426 [Pelagophyceae sp. CCMP2097]
MDVDEDARKPSYLPDQLDAALSASVPNDVGASLHVVMVAVVGGRAVFLGPDEAAPTGMHAKPRYCVEGTPEDAPPAVVPPRRTNPLENAGACTRASNALDYRGLRMLTLF